jgi:hypothetical protein
MAYNPQTATFILFSEISSKVIDCTSSILEIFLRACQKEMHFSTAEPPTLL